MSLKGLAAKAKQINAKTKELPFAEDFLRELDQTLVESETRDGDSQYVRTSLSPSTLGKCVRSIWYEFQGEKRLGISVDVNSTGIANEGTAMHAFIQENWLAKMEEKGRIKQVNVQEYLEGLNKRGIPTKFLKQEGLETKWSYERWPLPMRGKCDGLLEFRKKLVIFEFKTVDTNLFRNLIKPMQKHIFQAVTYGLAFNLRHVLFLYFDRNGGGKKAFLLEITDEMVQELEDRINFLLGSLIEDDPERDGEWRPKAEIPGVEPDRCKPRYCGFYDKCKAHGDCPK